jgi:hypothetical protein
VGALPRLIAHHVTRQTLLVDLVILVVVLAVFGGIWLRERRRRTSRSRSVPAMRD